MSEILVVEDEANIADSVCTGLREHGFGVELAASGSRALEAARETRFDLVILDLMLPDMDGIEVCRQLRLSGDVGVVILTARSQLGDRIRGFEAGADDYLPKPFAFAELLARVRAVLNRRSPSVPEILRIGDLTIDIPRRQTRRGDHEVKLTVREFDLLRLLAENAGRPVQREAILRCIWGDNFESESDPVKVYIAYLRQKLNEHGKKDLIHTLRGFGYVLKEDF